MSALVNYNGMRWPCFLLLVLLLYPILEATPLLAAGVIVEAEPNYVVVPTVVTNNETSVSYTWGYVCANITDIGIATPTVRGFEWGTDSGEPYTLSWNETGNFGEGEFCHNITGLSCNETYCFRGFATSSDGTGYGSEESFTTPVCVSPTVVTNNATGITNNSGVIHGSISVTGGANASTRGFEWGNSTGNYTSSWNETGSYGVGAFSHTVVNLTLGETVYWRAFATNTIGTGYSEERSFTTTLLPNAPTNFTITQIGTNSINITWTMGIGATTTAIKGSSEGCPGGLTGGYSVYNGTDDWIIVEGLSLTFDTYCYQAWSSNAYGYSEDFAEAQIGGMTMQILLLIFVAIALFFTWMAYKNRQMLVCLIAFFLWIGLGLWIFFSNAHFFDLEEGYVKILSYVIFMIAFVPLIWSMNQEIRHEAQGKKWVTYGAPPEEKGPSSSELHKKELKRRLRR